MVHLKTPIIYGYWDKHLVDYSYLDEVVENHKEEEDDAQEVGEHGQLDVAYHPVQKSGLKQNIIWVYKKSMLEQSPRGGDGGVSFYQWCQDL